MKQIHAKIMITGKVQGVGFRGGALHKAKQLGLNGWVKNNQNGGVEIEVEGSENEVGTFIDWCHEGTMLSRVDGVKTSVGELKKYINFSIRK